MGTESRMVVSRGCGDGEMESCLMGTDFQFCKMEQCQRAVAQKRGRGHHSCLCTPKWLKWQALCRMYSTRMKTFFKKGIKKAIIEKPCNPEPVV